MVGDPHMVGNSRSMIGTGVHCVDDLEFILGQTVVEVAAISDGQTEDYPLEDLVSLSLRVLRWGNWNDGLREQNTRLYK
ncbi:MAG: hypothetical protein CM1200mP27_08150 [Chloroflexota bacterium]|nr:MAG: hypothetical protein CM1200mP27_08150 [Chloroflexota bacterium]